ncbi:MAG: hypothetical protein ABJA37_03065 [Ferruginibacter sp.]
MKQAINKTKMVTMGIFAFYTMGLPQVTFAAKKTNDPVELKLISNIKSQPLFQLSLNNDEADEYFITVKDRDQNVLYSEKLKGINLSRKYQLAIDEDDLLAPEFGINIEVTSAKKHKTEVYKVRSRTDVVKNIEVAIL